MGSRILIGILLALSLSACARHKKTVNIAPDFQPYYARFVNNAAAYGHPVYIDDLIIEYGDLGPGDSGEDVEGACALQTDETPTIIINDNPQTMLWSYMDDAGHEELITHEMGHCVLGLPHESGNWVAPDGITILDSVMNPLMPDEDVYIKYHDHYMRQLFTGQN